MVQTCKHWVFTINNHNAADNAACAQLGCGPDSVYMVLGLEVGDTGTHHIQGYVALVQRRSLAWVKQRCGGRGHFERMAGTPQQAAEYCKKDGDFAEYGEVPTGQGKRSDLDNLFAAIKSGATREKVADEFQGTYLRYKRSVDELIRETADKARDRSVPPDVTVYWGDTGTGKTRRVFDDNDELTIYVHSGERWFDGYLGHDIALLDDYDGGHFKLSYLLRLLDRYPMKVPIKGAFVEWRPKKIFITSNKPPAEWYPNAYPEHQAALHRRLNTVLHFTS